MLSSTVIPPFFSGMSPEHHRIFLESSAYAEFGAGDVVFREGSPANSFFLIGQGTVALEANMNGEGLAPIAVLNDGEPLGWSWLFPPHVWHFHARALKRTTTTYFDARILRRLCEEDHDFGYELLKRLSQVMLKRLQSTRGEMQKLYGKRSPLL